MTGRLSLRVWWHKVRRHHVRDLGHPLGHRRIWCYDCRADLIRWWATAQAPPIVCMFEGCDQEAVWFLPDPEGIAGECQMCDDCYTESAQ